MTLIAAVLAVFLAAAPPWPQWGGPARDFAVAGTAGAARPTLLWDRELGPGHAGIVTDGDMLYTMARTDLEERVVALDADTGKTRWRSTYTVGGFATSDAHPGPHATPLLAGGLIVTAGTDGQIRAWRAATGELVWRRDLVREFRTDIPQFGYAASPVCWNDLVILPGLGGRAPAAIALRLRDGTTAWARHAFLSSHASPLVVRHGGVDHLVFHGMNRLVGLDPQSGDQRWSIWLREDAIDNVAFSPIWDAPRRQIIVSHGYDRSGVRAVRVERTPGGWSAREVWSNGRLKVEHGNAVLIDGVLYGSAGSFLTAIDLEDGRALHKTRGFTDGRVVAVGSEVLVLSEDGRLSLVRPGARSVETVWALDALEATAWTTPTVVGDRLYVRDRRRIKAYRCGAAGGAGSP